MMKKYKIVIVLMAMAAVAGGCGKQHVEAVNEKAENKKDEVQTAENASQTTVEEFCEMHGITLKEDGFSYVNVGADTEDLVSESDSTKDVEINENEEEIDIDEADETEHEIPYTEAKNLLTDEDKTIISMFVTNEDDTSIYEAEGSGAYEEFDVFYSEGKERTAISKKMLHTDKTEYDFQEVTFHAKVTEVYIEELESMDCLVMGIEDGAVNKVFYTNNGKTIWQIEQSAL